MDKFVVGSRNKLRYQVELAAMVPPTVVLSSCNDSWYGEVKVVSDKRSNADEIR